MEDVACCPGAGAMLTFATLGLLLTRTLGFTASRARSWKRLFDAMENAAQSLPKRSRPETERERVRFRTLMKRKPTQTPAGVLAADKFRRRPLARL